MGWHLEPDSILVRVAAFEQVLFKESLPSPADVVGATKWCVFRQTEPSRSVVETAVRERMTRMRTTTVDLLQVSPDLVCSPPLKAIMTLHIFKIQKISHCPALQILQDLQNEGLISAVGLCNFDAIRTVNLAAQQRQA